MANHSVVTKNSSFFQKFKELNMSLSKSLDQVTESGFNKMPRSIAKVISDSIEELKINGLAANAFKVGDTLPEALLTIAETKEERSLSTFIKNDFLILNFYRGGWCPYCNLELRAYEVLQSRFKQLGANVVAISTEITDIAFTTFTKNRLSYPVLTDLNAQLAKTIGITFHLNKDLQQEYSNFGINLSELHGNNEQELIVPAVFVIDKNRQVVWSHIEENYMTRAEPTEVLKVLENFNKKYRA